MLTLPEAFAGFGDPTVLFIASLFVVSEALDATGVTAWLGHQVVTRAGAGRARLTVIIGALAAVLTAFISINGAVAALLPVVVVVAVRAGIVPSKLLIPLAFAASAGSLLTLTGTPVNIVVSEAAVAAGGREFGFFEFALAGIPLVLSTVAVVALAADGCFRLVPPSAWPISPPILARTLRPFATATTSTSTRAACSARARVSPRCSCPPARVSSGARRRPA